MSRIAALFRFLGALGLFVIATPILLIWWAIYLLVASLIGIFLVALFRDYVLHLPLYANPSTFLDWIANIVIYGSAWCAATWLWADRSGVSLWFSDDAGDSHGSARFASRKELAQLEIGHGLLIGRNPTTGKLLRYGGPAHLLTLAPTRAGKGVGTVIPNLLMVDRSVIVIDPKGENARIAGATGMPSSAYNPLDRLTPDSLDLGEDAASLAEALVMDPPGQASEAHWNEEAKAILAGLIMFCVAHEEGDRRNLATVRGYLTLPPERLRALLELMQDSDAAHALIARAANRFLGKADREAASVLSNAQRHTHFLDSPRIANVISRSDFHFAELQQQTVSVFLVLPPNRLDAYARWLRLLVSEALQDITRQAEGAEMPTKAMSDLQGAPEASQAENPFNRVSHPAAGPTLFLLDEFAALGRLEAIERAMGLMAGYRLQLWPILQDMSQLNDLYGKRAGTFIANAGVQQVFGVNDLETAKWLSQMIGQETTGYRTESHKPGDAPSTSRNITGRDLLTPDEIMQIPPDLQLLRVQGKPTAVARKLRYYADPEFRDLFVPQDQ